MFFLTSASKFDLVRSRQRIRAITIKLLIFWHGNSPYPDSIDPAED
jgi:hypothetical protein